MYPILVKDQDQFETFVKTLKEKCLFSSANLLELIGEKENEYIVNFRYQDSKELLETKPMKKDQLFEFLDKLEKRFDGKIQYEWNTKNSPLCNKLGYFQLSDSQNKIRLDLMSEVETLKAYGTTYIKCNALFFNGNNVIFHKADEFYEIGRYSLNGNCLNIYVGLTLCENLHANQTYRLTKPKDNVNPVCFFFVLGCVMVGVMLLYCALFGGLIDQHKNTILQQSNLIKDLQTQIANLTLERDNAVNLLKTANIKIDKISSENSKLLKESIINQLIVPFMVIVCLIVFMTAYNDIKKSIDNISLVCKHDKYNDPAGISELGKLGKPDKTKKIDSNKSKESNSFLIRQNNLKEKQAKPLRRKFTTKYD